MDIIKKLFDYNDYRKFMKDYFAEMKKQRDFFSFRYFAGKAGFKSPNFCYYVINGERNLSYNSLKKVIDALGLKGKNASYFELLVLYNQENNIDLKKEYYKKIVTLRKSRTITLLDDKKKEFVSHWYYPVLRELVVYSNWNGEYSKIAKMLHPQISSKEAQLAIENMLELGIIYQKDGKYYQNESVVSLDKIPSIAKRRIRQEIIFNGLESLDNFSVEDRYTSYSTLTLTKKEYKAVTELLSEMRKNIVVNSSEKYPERVYQLVLQLYPVADIEGNGDKDEK